MTSSCGEKPADRGVGHARESGAPVSSAAESAPVKWPGIYVIGLTGGIASGKSTVSDMLAQLGAIIIDADRVSREVTMPGSEGIRRIREAFGDGVVRPDGSLNRHQLARIVFHDDKARATVNSIVHPLVMERVRQFLKEQQDVAVSEGPERVAVVDAPLLFEAGADAVCDEVWVVAISREDQAERLMKREGYTLEDALSRIDAQMSLEEKGRRATHIIDNRGAVEETRNRVLGLWKDLAKRELSRPGEIGR